MLARVTRLAPARAKRASALPPDERRSMIVAVALPLLLEHGERVTTRQIAEAAGIAEGTVFRAFADKDELVTAVLEAALDPGPLEAALDAIDPALPFEDAVAAAVAVLQQRVVDVWRVWSSVGTRFHDAVRRPLTDSHALVQLLERYPAHLTVEPLVAARLLRGLTLATTHPMLAGEQLSAADVQHVFLHGVSRPAGTGRAATC